MKTATGALYQATAGGSTFPYMTTTLTNAITLYGSGSGGVNRASTSAAFHKRLLIRSNH